MEGPPPRVSIGKSYHGLLSLCILPFPNGRLYSPLYCIRWIKIPKRYEKNFYMQYVGNFDCLLSKMKQHDVFLIFKGQGKSKYSNIFYHSLKLQDDQWVLSRMKVMKQGDPNIFVTVRSLSPFIIIIEQIFKDIISCT